VGGGLLLMTLAERFGQPFQVAGFMVLGAIQRIAELTLFGVLVFSNVAATIPL
jgi:hypothetical protein